MRAVIIRRLLYIAYAIAFLALSIGLLLVHSSLQERNVVPDFIWWAIEMAAVASIAAWAFHLAEVTRPWGIIEGIYAGFKASTLTLLVVSATGLVAAKPLPRQVTLGFWALMPIVVVLVWLPFRRVSLGLTARRLVVVGTEEEVDELSAQLGTSERDYEIVAHVNGFMGADRAAAIGGWLEVGEDRVREVTTESEADLIVIGPTKLADFDLLARISEVHAKGVRVRTFGQFYEERFGKVPLAGINETWFFFDSGELHRNTYIRVKRVMDILGALAGIAILGIILPFVALAIKLQDRGPIFYRQERVGKGGKIFKLIKFRTMRVDAEPDGPQWATRDDDRTTRAGRLLRRSRLDEVPQFVNVLKGDLSIVGPRAERPEFVAQLEELIPFYSRRHLIRPGLTGWAQVSYQYGSSVEHAMEKLQYEFYYMKYQSVLLDCRIIANTARVVLSMSGV